MLIEFFGFLFNIILGTIGHFLYDWSNNNKIIGFFFATDESIWQHLKLDITPVLLWIIKPNSKWNREDNCSQETSIFQGWTDIHK